MYEQNRFLIAPILFLNTIIVREPPTFYLPLAPSTLVIHPIGLAVPKGAKFLLFDPSNEFWNPELQLSKQFLFIVTKKKCIFIGLLPICLTLFSIQRCRHHIPYLLSSIFFIWFAYTENFWTKNKNKSNYNHKR